MPWPVESHAQSRSATVATVPLHSVRPAGKSLIPKETTNAWRTAGAHVVNSLMELFSIYRNGPQPPVTALLLYPLPPGSKGPEKGGGTEGQSPSLDGAFI